jgi:hypothetical protein
MWQGSRCPLPHAGLLRAIVLVCRGFVLKSPAACGGDLLLEEMVFVEGHYLLALDGTGYFASQKIHCESC